MKQSHFLKFVLIQGLILGTLCFASAQSTFSGGPGASLTGSSRTRPKPDWDYDGRYILGHIGADILLWDAKTGVRTRSFVGHKDQIQFARFSPDGKSIISTSGYPSTGEFEHTDPRNWPKDTSTRLWDVETGRTIWTIPNNVMGTLSADQASLITFELKRPDSNQVEMIVWDLSTHKKRFALKPYPDVYGHPTDGHVSNTVTFTKKNATILVFDSGTVSVFDGQSGVLIAQIKDVDSYNLVNDGEEFMTLGAKGLQVWSKQGKMTRKVPIKKPLGDESEWSADGSILSQTRFDERQNILRLSAADLSATKDVVVPHDGDVIFSPKQDRLLLFWDGTDFLPAAHPLPLQLALYDTRGEQLWHKSLDTCQPIGFSKDGDTILLGGGSNFTIIDSRDAHAIAIFDLLGNSVGNGFGYQFEKHDVERSRFNNF